MAGMGLPVTGTADAQGVPTWSVQYEGRIVTRGKDYHIVDLFDVSNAEIAALRAEGTKPIAYFSSQYENWRSDAGAFSSADLGTSLGSWPGERWVNTNSSAIRNIMLSRLDLAKARGFAGVDIDNVDFFYGPTGFDSSQSAAVSYVRFLADAAHARGLLFGLKNAVELIPRVADVCDYYINEEAHQYGEQNAYKNLGKPVFNIEYQNLTKGSPWMYTIYKKGGVMDEREEVVPNGAQSSEVSAAGQSGQSGQTNQKGIEDTWSGYYDLAYANYAICYSKGQPMLASAMYFYFTCLGHYSWCMAHDIEGDALWQYYYGVALYFYYAMLENGDEAAANYYYFTYVAVASYCYWAENGDLAAAYDTYTIYMGYAAAR